jgi:uncharacterized cupin superfamily protein
VVIAEPSGDAADHFHRWPEDLDLPRDGGSWSSDTGREEIAMDATDFCRILAGRPGPDHGQPGGLLAIQVPF